MMLVAAGLGAPPAVADPPASPDPAAGEPDDTVLDYTPATDQPTAKDYPAPNAQMLTPGQAVPHPHDVVLAHIFPSQDQIPSTDPVEQVPLDAITTALATAQQWWSDNTGLAFDFTTGLTYTTINTTCATYRADAMTATGHPGADTSLYAELGRNLLILEANDRCGEYGGITWQKPETGDAFIGGADAVSIGDWDGGPGNRESITETIAHEFGHTIGLGHANEWSCDNIQRIGDDQVGPLWDEICRDYEYGDASNIMGAYNYSLADQTLNTLQRWFLLAGWDIAVVDQPTNKQVVTISRYDLPTPGMPRGVVVSGGEQGVLSLEYRNADDTAHSTPGVYVKVADPTLSTHITQPIGLPPEAGNPVFSPHVPLVPGSTFVNGKGNVRLRTLSVNATTATVEVTLTELPGLSGQVLITQYDKVLTASTLYTLPGVVVSYQWLRNGEPIPGATRADYSPALPDQNAVYSVVGTLSAPDHADTPRYSRGIVLDDHRVSASGTDLTLALLDQNGKPVDCAGLPVRVDISTLSGQSLDRQETGLKATSETGVCRAGSLPLTGDLRVTVSRLANAPERSALWQTPYLESSATSIVRMATDNAAARLMVGVPATVVDFPGNQMSQYVWGVPMLRVMNGNRPLSVTVSVTDDTGAPAAGIPVTIPAMPGLVVTPADPVTDEYGFAYASLDWDRSQRFASICATYGINAFVPGVGEVQGTPAPVTVCGDDNPDISAWFEGDIRQPANGKAAAQLHVRVWDKSGNPITDQPDRVKAQVTDGSLPWQQGDVTVGDPVWNPADSTYVIPITSTSPQIVTIGVALDGGEFDALVPIEFTTGPVDRLTYTPGQFLASDGSCAAPNWGYGQIEVQPLDAMGNVIAVDGGVVYSLPAGSPLAFTTDPVVIRPGRIEGMSGYGVRFTSAVPGSFDIHVRTADGSVTTTITVTAVDARIDPDASSFTLSPGPVAPDGKDSYTVTARLVSVCHVPVRNLPVDDTTLSGYWVRLDATDPATGKAAGAVKAGPFVADAGRPGVYTSVVTATREGTYALTLNAMTMTMLGEWEPAPVFAKPLLATFVVPVDNGGGGPNNPQAPTGGAVSPGPGWQWALGAGAWLLAVAIWQSRRVRAGYRGVLRNQRCLQTLE